MTNMTIPRPRLFIGCSSENKAIAHAVQEALVDVAESTVFDQGVFRPGMFTLEALDEELGKTDFALFILASDDVVDMRGNTSGQTRDNVIFEAGLSIGKIGRRRTFLLAPSSLEDLHLPTDLNGITLSPYESNRTDNNWRAATGPATSKVREAIGELGPLDKDNDQTTSLAPAIKFFDLSVDHGKAYYDHIARVYRKAKKTIYISGRGYKNLEKDPEAMAALEKYLQSLEEALKRGVVVVRIQTSEDVSDSWNDTLARLVKSYPAFQLYIDVRDPSLVNVALIDPDDPENSEVQLLFEAVRHAGTERYYRAVSGTTIRGVPQLALGLQQDFIARVEGAEEADPLLDRTTIEQITALNVDEKLSRLYFAFGSNLSTEQLKRRGLSVNKVANGVLYDWRLVLNVTAPHRKGNVAGIEAKKGATVFGVVYRLTPNDWIRLTEIEGGGYQELRVDIKSNENNYICTTFVPVRADSGDERPPDKGYLETMISGAREHELETLLVDLNAIYSKHF